MKLLITTTILFLHLITFEQTKEKPGVHDLSIPKTLNQCFVLLDKTMPDNEIGLIKTLPEDSIYNNSAFKNGTDFFHAWKLYSSSQLTEYFNKLGLYGSYPIYNTILISYHRYLNKDSIRLHNQINRYQVIQEKENEEYLVKVQKDTLNSVYIPTDLRDCFVQLDKIVSENDKTKIKNLKSRQETIQYHHGLGTTLRNTWGLWGGSRLQKYFLARKIDHPDSMSSLILEYYYDWLNGNNDAWQKWVR